MDNVECKAFLLFGAVGIGMFGHPYASTFRFHNELGFNVNNLCFSDESCIRKIYLGNGYNIKRNEFRARSTTNFDG